MAYQIMYSPEDNHKYPAYKPAKKKRWLIPAVLTALLLVAATRPQIRSVLEKWLIPGNTDVTKAAFTLMLEDIRTGEPVGQAVSAFCREILENGQTVEILDT